MVAPTKKPSGASADFDVATVGGDGRALAGAVLDEFADAVGVLAGDDRTHVGLGGGVRGADPDGPGGVDERGEELFGGVADHDGGAARHATLARAAEGGFDHATHGPFDVGVGHDDDVVLRAAVGLDALAVPRARLVDGAGDGRAADEADGADLGMGQEGVHGLASAVDEVEDAGGQARLLEEFGDADGGEGDFFAGLEDEGVAADEGDRVHPERDHRRKVEGRDAHANAEGLADGVAVDAARDVGQNLAHEQRRDAAGELDHLDAAPHVATGFHEGLAVLAGDELGEGLEMVFEQHLEAEEDAGALGGRGVGPGGKGGAGGLDGVVHGGGGAERGLRDDLAARGIEDGRGLRGRGGEPLAADEIGNGSERGGSGHGGIMQAEKSVMQAEV